MGVLTFFKHALIKNGGLYVENDKIFPFIVLFMLILSLAISGCAAKEEPDIDALLAPYQEVLDRLNEENGWTLAIPEQALEKV